MSRKKENLPEVVPPSPFTEKSLSGQVALVTGASSGIGRGIALELGKAGAEVVVNYRSDKRGATEVAGEIAELGSTAYIHQADVSREAEVTAMFSHLLRKSGTVDILVNNAGIQDDAPIEEMSLDQWNKVIQVNLTSQFLCTREAIKEFKRRGVVKEISCAAGKVICISSVHEIIPWAGRANYAASKGGVMLFMKSIAQETAPYRIRLNSIAPGAVRTSINTNAWDTPEAYDRLMELVPYNRIGETDDIGRAAVWLASDASDYVNGTTLVVDGGMTLYPGFTSGG